MDPIDGRCPHHPTTRALIGINVTVDDDTRAASLCRECGHAWLHRRAMGRRDEPRAEGIVDNERVWTPVAGE